MRIFLISDEQIQKLYDAVSTGSRDFERVISAVKSQEVTVEKVKAAITLEMVKPK